MDHVQKNEKIKQLTDDIIDANDACDNLLSHLTAKKFHCGSDLDGYINVDDVRRYVLEIKSNL